MDSGGLVISASPRLDADNLVADPADAEDHSPTQPMQYEQRPDSMAVLAALQDAADAERSERERSERDLGSRSEQSNKPASAVDEEMTEVSMVDLGPDVNVWRLNYGKMKAKLKVRPETLHCCCRSFICASGSCTMFDA